LAGITLVWATTPQRCRGKIGFKPPGRPRRLG
jgi:hypothetical protein